MADDPRTPPVPLSDDTIAAIITPPGEGGVAAIRLAGRRCLSILEAHFEPTGKTDAEPFVMRHGVFSDSSGHSLDEVMAVYMPEGRSYTGLEQVELFCHGGRLVVRQILEELLASGARAAEPGEFTRLAFMAGKIDLARAEAVAEIISANTESSLVAARDHLLGDYSQHIDGLRRQIISVIAEVEASIDFPEEEIEPETIDQQRSMVENVKQEIDQLTATYTGGQIIREGFKVAIGGRPNAGKSTLFNLLLREERALVTPTAGTTRDYLSEWIDIGGFGVNLIDTAGIRKGGGKIERAGQKSAHKIMESAHLVLWICDISRSGWQKTLSEDLRNLSSYSVLVAGNKLDLAGPKVTTSEIDSSGDIVFLSCKTGAGLQDLEKALLSIINEHAPDLTSGLVVTSARHQQKLKAASASLQLAGQKLEAGESPEIIAFELREAANAIEEILGRVYNEDILGEIFSKFCVGK